jgi:hypothetical protein
MRGVWGLWLRSRVRTMMINEMTCDDVWMV